MQLDKKSSPLRHSQVLQNGNDTGLDLHILEQHCSRFKKFKENGMRNFSFPIKDTCRIDNGRIVPYAALQNFPENYTNVISFIPAAGSSTRYIQPIYNLIESTDPNELQTRLEATQWVLPPQPDHTKGDLGHLIGLAKGLFPCVCEGHSFLRLKFLEQRALGNILKTVCVAPKNQSEIFAKHAQSWGWKNDDLLVLEQGTQLSTPRLDAKGHLIREANEISLAPAGHGSLMRLFPKIQERFPDAQTLFIRNIDNVIGCKEDALTASRRFLGAHHFALKCLQNIRTALANKNLNDATHEAQQILECFPKRALSSEEDRFVGSQPQQEQPLWSLLLSLFQTPLGLCLKSNLLQLFERPLNFMAQVPNSGHDQGGMPVLISTPLGDQAICLEGPHISPVDQERLRDPKFATHFNPVFAAVELHAKLENYQLDNSPYWIFAEKQWQGQNVYYHESLLYELIGNSENANLIFIELPRVIFNPHKTLDDSIGRSLEHWM